MFKIVHLVTGVAALLLALMPSLRTEATPFLQQPDAVYLALLGLLNLLLAPVVPVYYRGARQQLQYLACALLAPAPTLTPKWLPVAWMEPPFIMKAAPGSIRTKSMVAPFEINVAPLLIK